MKLDLHYVDPRLVALYDRDNPRGADTDFYCALADDLNARTVVDLGCGTGLLTRELAKDGRRVIGVDPSREMLAAATRQPGAGKVAWILGDSGAIGRPDADLAVMTGNVAQVFLEEDAWTRTLRDIRQALRPGGRLAFESRNPEVRGWEAWTRQATHERFDWPDGPLECWLELVSVTPERVVFEAHNVFARTGEDLVARSELRFRSRDELARSLADCGYAVEAVYGDWHRNPVVSSSKVLVFLARRSDGPLED